MGIGSDFKKLEILTTEQILNLKKLSLVLVILATTLLTINIIDIKMVFGKRETGLWDTMPVFVRQIMFLAYPISLLTSFILYIYARKMKTKFDSIATILFLLNGLVIILLLVIYFTELTKNL